MLGQDRGDVVREERRVEQVLDIGPVDTEEILDARRHQLRDDVVHHRCLLTICHLLPLVNTDTRRMGEWFNAGGNF